MVTLETLSYLSTCLLYTSLIAVFSVVVCHSFSNRLMFVLFVDVLVVVSDVLAVGDVLTLGCYAVFNEPVRQLLQGRDGTAPMQGGRHRAQNRDSNALGASHMAVPSLSCHCVWGCTLPIFLLLHAITQTSYARST